MPREKNKKINIIHETTDSPETLVNTAFGSGGGVKTSCFSGFGGLCFVCARTNYSC